MADPIFVRTRYVYGSYTDLWRLVELAEFPTCYTDEVDAYDAGKTYILPTLNGEWNAGWTDVTARLIHYDLEWRLDGEYPQIPGVRETWAADAWYAGKIGAKYVPLGSDERLAGTNGHDEPKQYDVAVMAYIWGRRDTAVYHLKQAGVSIAPNGWDEERNTLLRQSKAMLHIHQQEFAHTIAPQRWCLAAAYRLPMISEDVQDRGIFGHSHALWVDYPHIAPFVRMWTCDPANETRLMEFGEALHSLLCKQFPFRKCIEAAL